MLRFGLNTKAQNTIEKTPSDILIDGFHCLTYRGKRIIEVNSRKTTLENIDIRDVYSPARQDSQAIWIGNTPGDILIQDFYLEAASENILVGGDPMDIPNTRPSNIVIRRGVLTKPIDWMNFLSTIPVKNLLELKDGHNVTIEDVEAYNCWRSGQGGYAFMFTPASGGSLRNIKVIDCKVYNVGGIVNITGTDAAGINKERSQIVFQGGKYKTDHTKFPGRGDFALIGRGPESLEVYDAKIEVTGAQFIYVTDRSTIDRLVVKRCTFNTAGLDLKSRYEFTIGPNHYGNNSLGIIKQLVVEDNVITGASKNFKNNFPNNTFV